MTDTVRYFGRCPECSHRVTVEHASSQHLRRVGSALLVADAAGNHWPLNDHGPQWREAMSAAGLACPADGAVFAYRRGQFMLDPDKACDGRCMSANSPRCSCSCGGENHGSLNIMVSHL